MRALAVTSFLAVAAVSVGGAARASEWAIDPSHTTAQFSVRHLMVTDAKGSFGKVAGTLDFNDKDPTKSVVEVTIETSSIDTGDAKRDEHLKSPDFFDAANHPQITFKSTQIKKTGKDKYKVVGDLTMRGVTKPVTLDVVGPTAPIKNPWGMTVRGVSASGKLNRKDFGLNWNKALEAGGVLVGEEVKIQIDGELVEKPAAPVADAKPAAPAEDKAAKPKK